MRNTRIICPLLFVIVLLNIAGALFAQILDNDTLAKFDLRITVNKSGWGNRVSFTGKNTRIIGKPSLSVCLSGDGKFVIITPHISIKGDDEKILSEADLFKSPWLVPHPKLFPSKLTIGCGPHPLNFDPASVKNGSIHYPIDRVFVDRHSEAKFYFLHQVIRGNTLAGRSISNMTTLHIHKKSENENSASSDSSQSTASTSSSKPNNNKPKVSVNPKKKRTSPPVARAEIEKHHASGKSLIAVTADGVSTLNIPVYFTRQEDECNRRGVKSIKVLLSPTGVGHFSQRIGNKVRKIPSSGEIILKNWNNDLVYHPPAYLTEDAKLTETIRIKGDSPNTKPVYGIPINVELVFKTDQETVRHTCKFNVIRPPVFLVHGFTGDKTTWESLDLHLNRQKFRTIREGYFNSSGNTGIKDLQKFLKMFIERELKAFIKTGIRLTKVDIVAHSMGGLIARSYLKELTFEGQTTNVRKLIMVGTPNHGVDSLFDHLAGMLSQKLEGKHKQGLSDMQSYNWFIKDLNRNEAGGGHLHQHVEYANIIGKLRRYTRHTDFYLDTHDAVITNASSHLNQVIEFVYPAHIHSPASPLVTLWPNNTSITLSKQVFLKIRECLLSKLARQGSDMSSISLQATKGNVKIQGPLEKSLKAPTNKPCSLYAGTRIVTGSDGGAAIRFTQRRKRWGDIVIGHDTDMYMEFTSPKRVHLVLTKGHIRCKTQPDSDAHFEVLSPENNRIVGLDTDFEVNAQPGKPTTISSYEGKVLGMPVTSNKKSAKASLLPVGKIVKLSSDGNVTTIGVAKPAPWTNNGLDGIASKHVKTKTPSVTPPSTPATPKTPTQKTPPIIKKKGNQVWTPLKLKNQNDWYGAYELAEAQFPVPFHFLYLDGKKVAFKQQGSDGIDDQRIPETTQLKNLRFNGNKFSSYTWEGQMVMYNLNFRSKNGPKYLRPGLLITQKGSGDQQFYKRQEVSVLGSSFLRDKKNIARYWPDNAVQAFTNPTWAEGVKGYGIGEWLKFSFAVPKSVTKIRIVNGYTRSKDLFKKNSRAKVLQGITSTGKNFELTLKDTMKEQDFSLNLSKKETWIKLVIKSVYKGSKYDDTCISEVNFDYDD